jgi:hypothetical protein
MVMREQIWRSMQVFPFWRAGSAAEIRREDLQILRHRPSLTGKYQRRSNPVQTR